VTDRPTIELRNMGSEASPDMRFCFVIGRDVHVFPFGTTWKHVQGVMLEVREVMASGESGS